jgi:glutathione S-transferase
MYILHSVPDWASLIVHLVLEEMGAPFARRVLDPDAGDLDADAYRQINPQGLVPALETPDGPMFETGAILLYLSERHGLAPAPGRPERAAFLSWFAFVQATVHPTVMALLHPYRVAGEGQAAEVGGRAQARLRAQLASLDAMVARRRPVWLSGEPSVLGFYLGVMMRWAQAFPYVTGQGVAVADYPALHAMLAALETRPAALAVAAREGMTGRFLTEARG